MLIGFPFNTLAFLTMQRKELRNTTTCIYLSFLALSDNFSLAVEGSYLIALSYFNVYLDVELFCIPLPYLNSLGKQMTSWFLVLTTVDRTAKVSE